MSMLPIQSKVRGRHPLVLVRTTERTAPARIVGAVQEALIDRPTRTVLWTPGLGLRAVQAQKAGHAWLLKDMESPTPVDEPATWLLSTLLQPGNGKAVAGERTVVLLQSPASWLNAYTAGLLASFSERARERGWTAILVGAFGDIPEALRSTPVLNMPLPSAQELGTHLEAAIAAAAQQCGIAPAGTVEKLSTALLGLTETEAQDTLSESQAAGYLRNLKGDDFWADVTTSIGNLKAGLLETAAGIRLHTPLEGGLAALGGLAHYKPYLQNVAARYSMRARRAGLTPAGATLVVGVPGTGKTYSARALAGELWLPVVEFDPGTVQSKWVGETEGQLETVLTRIDAFGPCVLLIDEAGKLFDIEGADDTYCRVFTRLVKYLEQIKVEGTPVHVILTSNEYQSMRAEFLSRMDRIWWMGFPGPEDRCAILGAVANQLHRRAEAIRKVIAGNGGGEEALTSDPFDFAAVDFQAVAQATAGYTGRDMRKVLELAAEESFKRDTRPDTALVLSLLGDVPSTKSVSAGKVRAMFEEVRSVSGGEVLLAAEPSEADLETWHPLYSEER